MDFVFWLSGLPFFPSHMYNMYICIFMYNLHVYMYIFMYMYMCTCIVPVAHRHPKNLPQTCATQLTGEGEAVMFMVRGARPGPAEEGRGMVTGRGRRRERSASSPVLVLELAGMGWRQEQGY